jgi:hypothetical protein
MTKWMLAGRVLPLAVNDENEAHAGVGNQETANDRLLPIGGVMSRD